MSKKFHLLWAVFPLLIAILLYGYTVRIPFYLDDIPNFQIVTEGDGIEQWDGDPAFPYYRPMTFSVWKLVDEIISPRQPAVYHWLNVLLFGATGVLIGQIAYHLSQKSRGAMGIAGTAFIIFPFSYQAVIWISSFFHILTGFAVCLSLWASVRWLQKRAGFPILMLVWFSALAGTFAHENGVLLLPFMVGLVMVRAFRVRPNFWRTAAILLPVIALSGVYLGLRYTVPHAAEAYITRNVSPNFTASYFLQGLGYPTHAAARRILGYGEASPYINLSMALTIGLAGLTLVLVWFRAPPPDAASTVRSWLVFDSCHTLYIFPGTELHPRFAAPHVYQRTGSEPFLGSSSWGAAPFVQTPLAKYGAYPVSSPGAGEPSFSVGAAGRNAPAKSIRLAVDRRSGITLDL
ncbi:MAG: hypothetical protein F9K27_07635 [Anaerolineae bacterium]|nr:MAG: hypothetical protein F9K27_07635 [Anaerolineae bacterium]